MGKEFKNYPLNPNASDIVPMDDDVGDIGFIRITDDDDIDIVEAFSNTTFDRSDPCAESESPPEGAGPWKIIGVKRGASWQEDSLTFDSFDDGDKALSSLYDASRGTIDGYGNFPYSRPKCQAFARNMASVAGGSEGSPWLSEAGPTKYAQLIIGFDVVNHGSHPWGEYGNWKDGHIKGDSFYKYDDANYAASYVKYIGSKSHSPAESAGIPHLSANILWVDDGYGNGEVRLFANSSVTPTMIQVTEEKVTINTVKPTSDGSIHQININGMTNKDGSQNPNVPGSANITDILQECEAKVIEVEKLKKENPYLSPTNLIQIGIRG